MRIQQYNLVLDEKEKATLVRESGRNYSGVEHLDSPGNVARLMRDVFKLHERAEEYVYLVCTNAKCKPTGFFEVSHGTCGYALISPREILIRALLCGAVCILLVHNHRRKGMLTY